VITSKADVLQTLAGYLRDSFEVPDSKIRLEASLFEDLDLDSIDAVDLVVQLQEYAGRKIPVAEFKTVRTVGDVVDQVYALVNR
jgi:acyl carrier protein